MLPHSYNSFPNIENGPFIPTFLNRPKIESSA